jgi:5-methylcytosine-specific restriction endonuclease McrA
MNTRKNKNHKLKLLILSRIGLPCPCCGEVMDENPNHSNMATVEHIIPLDHGGTNDPSNIDIICLSCNRARNSVKQHFDNRYRRVPSEYWQCSLRNSLIYIIDRFYKEYHIIFLIARFGKLN